MLTADLKLKGRGEGEKMFEPKWPRSQCYVAAAAVSWLIHCESAKVFGNYIVMIVTKRLVETYRPYTPPAVQ